MTIKPQPIVVVGGGGHAKVLLNILARLSQFEVLGYVDPRDGGSVLGFSRLGGDDALPALATQRGMAVAIGVGKISSAQRRLALMEQLQNLGFGLPPIIAPSAILARDVVLGAGTVVMDGAIIQPGSIVGKICIINTAAVVDHDCVLGNDVHICPSATLSGQVTVGDGSLVGVGASIIQGRRIGDHCVIGAGAAVTEDCLEAATYVGVPAKKMVSR